MADYTVHIFALIEYERWCNARMMDRLATLREEEIRRDFGFGWRTPHCTMFHVADVMQGWGRAVQPCVEKPTWLDYDPGLSLLDIRELLDDAAERLRLAASASHERGLLAEDRRLTQVFHLITHGTHHRGQLLSMITLLGHPQPFEGGDFGGWSR